MQKSIPFYQIRGGSSKGLYFKAEDLPSDENERNELLLLAMEGTTEGDPRQIDGLGGATSLSSKVAIVSKSPLAESDLDYFFVQVVVGKGKVSTTQTCGNILAGILPFAIETGMIEATHPTTKAKINIVNTGGICEVVVQTPNGEIETKGDAKVDGVVGTSAPIICNYLETVGSTCGALLPTGNVKDILDGVETTCIDNGMPIVIMRASDFGLVGNESKETLDANEDLMQKIEAIRLKAGFLMNLGDVKDQTIPKMCLVSPPQNGGAINTRMFIPHVVHEAIGVLAAVSVATACVIPDTVCGEFTNDDLRITNDDLRMTNNDLRLTNNDLRMTNNDLRLTNNDLRLTNNDLRITNDDLRITNDDLRMTNNDLRLTNNDLRLTNNDLRITNDDLRITNDDLRITNDDLRITNDDLRITNDDLRITNDDLRMTNENLSLFTHHSSLSIEHPTGEFTVNLEYELNKLESDIHHSANRRTAFIIKKSGVIRTARILSRGEVFIP